MYEKGAEPPDDFLVPQEWPKQRWVACTHIVRARPPCYRRDLLSAAALDRLAGGFQATAPFDHKVIDGFFDRSVAEALLGEFPGFDAPCWHRYANAVENKRACNDWNAFGPATYRAFASLTSAAFADLLSGSLGLLGLSPDPGLNGGGWHVHGGGGRLNPHLDYSLHPKTGLQRRLNVIVYLTPDWQPEWGGGLGLWEQAGDERKPGRLAKTIMPRFNRAVIFDTSQKSWHGLASPVAAPHGVCRRSLAVSYMSAPTEGAEDRRKALFAPTGEQEADPAILGLIARRADAATASDVWREGD
jgi:hypothetical protein